MNVEDIAKIVNQMKAGTVPSRLVFIWTGPTKQLDKILDGIEVHRHDLAEKENTGQKGIEEPQQFLESQIKSVCKKFEETRQEPSALMLKNAVLLVRYGCDLSAVYRYGISPRAAVIFLMPKESHRHLPPRTDGWVKRNTKEVIAKMSKQLGKPNCIIDA
jgi:hypothetical protein